MIQGLENNYCTCALGSNITRWTMQTSYPKQVTVKDAVSSDVHNKFLSAAIFTVRVNNQWKEAFHNYTNNPLFLENSGVIWLKTYYILQACMDHK